MSDQTTLPGDLASKIASLVQERGWNQEEFSRIAKLNRQTVRQILRQDNRKIRSATVNACANALGVSVHDLISLPLKQLTQREHVEVPAQIDESLRRRYEQASQPELRNWLHRNQERAKQIDEEEMDELLSLQGVGGPLTERGVEHFVAQIERRRELVHKVRTIAGTELGELLEKMVNLLYEKVQPYRNRKGNP